MDCLELVTLKAILCAFSACFEGPHTIALIALVPGRNDFSAQTHFCYSTFVIGGVVAGLTAVLLQLAQRH